MAIDFITAFGRLLRDGNLRDLFALNPQHAAEQIQLRPVDHPAWLQLVPEEVEFQAGILLRKRLDLVKIFAPETSRRLGAKLWPAFYEYARVSWPPEGSARISDAFHFYRHLKEKQPEAVVAMEWNRLAFVSSNRRAALHLIKIPASRRGPRRGLQLLIRGKDQIRREYFVYLGL